MHMTKPMQIYQEFIKDSIDASFESLLDGEPTFTYTFTVEENGTLPMDIDEIIDLIRDFVEVEPVYHPESTHLLAYCLYCGEFPEHKETCPYRRAKEFLEEIEVPNA